MANKPVLKSSAKQTIGVKSMTKTIRVVEFSNGIYKIRKIFAKESTYPKKIFEFGELD